LRNFRGRILQCLLLSFVCFSTCEILAQTGSISGIVRDASGAVIPGATVNLISSTTGTSRDVVTSNAGTYSLVNLQPTAYTLTVDKGGFQKAASTDVIVTVGEVVPLNIKRQLGSATTEVGVNGVTEGPVETDLPAQHDYRLPEINNLPLILRDPHQLVLLSPGVASGSSAGGTAVNGARDRNINIMLDESDNNDSCVQGQLAGECNRTAAAGTLATL